MLRAVAILHRHGARGPGDSELAPWHEDDHVSKQWLPHECENLSVVGVQQLRSLGSWVAQTYIHPDSTGKIKMLYRCSTKSDRARESGKDFVTAFNEKLRSKVSPVEPLPYEVSPDYYFRPWKLHKEAEKLIKKKKDSPIAGEIVEENKEFLLELGARLGVKEEYTSNLRKMLWSTTHVLGLLECESYWPSSLSGKRSALISRTDFATVEKATQLATWVWEERFVRSDFRPHMGGWLFLDMVQSCFDPNYDICSFSGHDYTIIAVLSAVGAINRLNSATAFGSYVAMELWEGTPPPASTSTVGGGAQVHERSTIPTIAGSSDDLFITPRCVDTAVESESVPATHRILRIKWNSQPFDPQIFLRTETHSFNNLTSTLDDTIPGALGGSYFAGGAVVLSDATGVSLATSGETHSLGSGDGTNPQARELSSDTQDDSAGAQSFKQPRFEEVLASTAATLPSPPPCIGHDAAVAIAESLPPLQVQHHREIVVVEYDMPTLKAVVERLCEELVSVGVGLPPGFRMPEFL